MEKKLVLLARKKNPRLQIKNMNDYLEIMNNLNLPKPKLIDVTIKRNLKLGAI